MVAHGSQYHFSEMHKSTVLKQISLERDTIIKMQSLYSGFFHQNIIDGIKKNETMVS